MAQLDKPFEAALYSGEVLGACPDPTNTFYAPFFWTSEVTRTHNMYPILKCRFKRIRNFNPMVDFRDFRLQDVLQLEQTRPK